MLGRQREDEAPQGHIVITGQGLDGAGRIPLLYARAVDAAGGHPRIYSPFTLRDDENIPEKLPVESELEPGDTSCLDGAVGLLLPGGGDIDPALYNRPRHPRTEKVSRRRDDFELAILREALERDMPMFLICRGFQLVHVLLGGTLDQHLADHPERLEHWRDMPRAEPAHEVHVKEGSKLAEILGTTDLEVNSHHHQGPDTVPDELEPVAWATDGVLEGCVMRDRTWVVGVQWHPEVMAPVDHREARLFEHFVRATETYGEAIDSLLKAQSA
jgi:putative glutamine amidotransferase